MQKGYAVEVLLHDGAEPLGGVLYHIGTLDRDRYIKAQMLSNYGRQRIGQALVRARLLDREELKEGLRAQVRRRLHSLFLVHDAQFHVFSGSHARGTYEGEPLLCDPMRIIYFGIRRTWSENQICTALRSAQGQEFRLDRQQAAEVVRWGYISEARICEFLSRGFFTLPEILDASELAPIGVYALIYSLWISGKIDQQAAIMARPPRRTRQISKQVGLLYRPIDEIQQEALLPEVGRRVVLHKQESPPVPVMIPRLRPVPITPIAGQVLPALMSESVKIPGSGTPPPLRTSLPQSRLPNKPQSE